GVVGARVRAGSGATVWPPGTTVGSGSPEAGVVGTGGGEVTAPIDATVDAAGDDGVAEPQPARISVERANAASGIAAAWAAGRGAAPAGRGGGLPGPAAPPGGAAARRRGPPPPPRGGPRGPPPAPQA